MGQKLTRYERDVLNAVKDNHIWINAFNCIRPTDEFKIQLANSILKMLNERESLIESDFDGTPMEDLHQKELVVRINKS